MQHVYRDKLQLLCVAAQYNSATRQQTKAAGALPTKSSGVHTVYAHQKLKEEWTGVTSKTAEGMDRVQHDDWSDAPV
jgi:hypothetical protein